MCNLSVGIREDGYEAGVEKTTEKFIISMNENGLDEATIARAAKITVEQVKTILEKHFSMS